MNTPVLSIMIIVPLLGAIAQALISNQALFRPVALFSSIFSAIIGVIVLGADFFRISPESLSDHLAWVGSYSISYVLAVDGLSRVGILIVSILFPVLMGAEWARIKGARGFYALLLILQSSLLGVVCAQDLFLLFFFLALSSLPPFFLLGVWGGEFKERAAIHGLIVSALSNAFILGSIILIYYANDPNTFLIRDLTTVSLSSAELGVGQSSLSLPGVAYFLFCAGVALRIPLWPLQGWFARLFESAPASVSVAVSGAVFPSVLLVFTKISLQLFPDVFSAWSGAFLVVGLVSMLVGALSSFSQTTAPKLLVSFVLLEVGIFLVAIASRQSSALTGMFYHMLSFSLSLACMGLVFGIMIGWSPHFLRIKGEHGQPPAVFGGPVASAVMAVSLAAAVGIPGLSGFVGQSLVMMGSYSKSPPLLLVTTGSMFLITICFFGVYRNLFLSENGSAEPTQREIKDLLPRERAFLVPLVVLMVFFGLYPRPLLEVIRPAAEQLLFAKEKTPSSQSTAPDLPPPPLEAEQKP